MAVTGIGVIAGAATAGGVALLKMSSDAAETASKFNTVFSGGEAGQATSWLRGIQGDVHIATQELQEAASTFGVFGQAAGVRQRDLAEFSTALAQAGLDLASFSNANPEDVFLALRSGLSGEAEPLRQFGIFLSDASLNAFAASQGIHKTTAEMSEQEKVLLRQQYILSHLGAAEGDLDRTASGLANQTRGLVGVLKDLGTQIGDVLRPAAEKLLPILTDGLGDIVERLRDRLPDLQRRVGDWADQLVRLYRTIRDGRIDTSGFDRQIEAVFGQRFGGFLNRAIDLVGALRDNISDLGVRGGLRETIDEMFGPNAAATFDDIATVLDDLFTTVRDLVVPAWNGAIDALGPAAGFGLHALGDALSFAAEHAEELEPLLEMLFGTYLTAKTVGTIRDIAGGIRGLGRALGFMGGATGAGAAATGLGGVTGAAAGANTTIGLLAATIGALILPVAGLAAAVVGFFTASDIASGHGPQVGTDFARTVGYRGREVQAQALGISSDLLAPGIPYYGGRPVDTSTIPYQTAPNIPANISHPGTAPPGTPGYGSGPLLSNPVTTGGHAADMHRAIVVPVSLNVDGRLLTEVVARHVEIATRRS